MREDGRRALQDTFGELKNHAYFRLKLRLLGARVHTHWSAVLVVAIIAALAFKTPIYAALFILSYLGVIAIHEAGHAIVAIRLGYEVSDIRIGWFHGLCEHSASHYEWEEVMVAWGGVTAQAVVGIPIVLLGTLFGADPGYFGPVLMFLGYVNLAMAAFNLLPIEPLDGKKAWRIVPMLMEQAKAKRATDDAIRRLRKRR